MDSVALRLSDRFSGRVVRRDGKTSECVQIPGYRASTLYGPYVRFDAAAYNTSRTRYIDKEDTCARTRNLSADNTDGRSSGRD